MAFITWPPMGVIARSLPNHRGLALGIVIGGSSLGGVVWPIMLERLLNHSRLGFGWVIRVVAFTMLPLLAFACLTIREPRASLPPPLATEPSVAKTSEKEPSSDTNAEAPAQQKAEPSGILLLLKNKVFICFASGLAIVYLGLFIPFFYISSFATAKGVSAENSFYLISALNAASLVGRILPGHLADRHGHYNICILAIFGSAIVAFSWTAATSLARLIVISIAYGFTSGVGTVQVWTVQSQR